MVNEIKERIDELSQNFNEEVENTKEIEIIKKNDSEKKNSRNKKKTLEGINNILDEEGN